MKKGHLYFETVLMSITLLLGLPALLVPGEMSLLFLMWMIALGILQVFHSFFIAAAYWDIQKIKINIIIYWIITAIDLSVLLFGATVNTDFLFLIIIPMLLAGWLWFITFDGRSYPSNVELKLEGEQRDQ